MNLLLVTFSLRNPEKDYTSFFVTIRGNAINWFHFIEQTILISSMLPPAELAGQLYPLMENTDSLLITKVEPHQFQGWLPPAAWAWLNDVSSKMVAQQESPETRLPRLPSAFVKP